MTLVNGCTRSNYSLKSLLIEPLLSQYEQCVPKLPCLLVYHCSTMHVAYHVNSDNYGFIGYG